MSSPLFSFIHNLTLTLLFISFSAFAFDTAKETRMRDQVIDYVMDGEVEILQAGSHDFLSIYMQSEQPPAKGAIIIVHGRGFHPNWPKMVYPLRTGLTKYGWNTLSIQMPVLDNQASFYDYLDILDQSRPRLNAAVAFLKKQQITNIIILAHSCGVHMAIDWLVNTPNNSINAFIGVGMGSTDYGQPMLKPFPLEKFTFPILDIRGSDDYPSVSKNAPRRWQHIQQGGNKKSQQRVVKDAEHYFVDREDVLLEEIGSWLNTLSE